jgi:hypothetical protein
MKLLALLFSLLAFATTVDARVISYAPYTTTPAAPGLHSRTSRYFVLLEGENEWWRQAVLYDTTEAEEPRVVYPDPAGQQKYTAIEYVALHEPLHGGPPMLLVGTAMGAHFSGDGGATWRRVQTVAPLNLTQDAWIDHGGPNTQPLWYPVQTGNDARPFAVLSGGKLRVIDANGVARELGNALRVLGRDREGNRFLVRREHSIDMIDVWGNHRTLFTTRPTSGYDGWITPEGQAFIQEYRSHGTFLWHYRNRSLYFVAGPADTGAPVLDITYPRVEELRFFAIPTHDFRGAWMIQRQEGRPTTLLRYVNNELQTMWSDPSGREVEALIAGNSGQTLLVQVHVPRDVDNEIAFVDPALAVWHVGDPMPSHYDELYLHEEPNKGFLHVDVDRIESGEPFVFNSGIVFQEQLPEEGPISPPIGSGADVFQEWGVVRASLKQRLVLPGVTRTAGANGSQWSTDVTIYNPLEAPQKVEVRYVAAGADPARSAARLTRTITLAPRELHHVPDVLHSLFLVAASGGTLFFTPDETISVVARTKTTRADGGTYGYAMHAIDFLNAAGPRFPLTFAGAFPGEGFRTNVMLTDTSGRGAVATLNGSSVGTFHGGVAQWSASPLQPPSANLVLQPSRGTIIPMVVTIDNHTNDATWYPPDLGAATARSIPLVASTSTWKTDLYAHNASPHGRVLVMEARPWNGGPAVVRRRYVESRQSWVARDVLTLFGISGFARLRLLNDVEELGEGVRVTSRLYATDAKSGGTYGTLAPALNNFQTGAPGDQLVILGITPPHRFDLALVELGGANARVRIRIFDARSREVSSVEETIGANQGRTIEGIAFDGPSQVVVEVLEGGVVGTFATLVDRITGDPTYLPASLGAK